MYKKQLEKILTIIKAERVKMGYPQSYMAEKMNISQNMYSKIELGKTQITACKFLMICDLLDIDAGELLRDE